MRKNTIRVEHLQQRLEVAAPGGGQEGVHHPALQGEMVTATIGLRGRLHPTAARASAS